MVHFFRRIRQKLLANNQMKKYILYAIGEIALVMIGILLALQVNNWNEGRKNRLKEKVYLENLKSDLVLDIDRQKDRLNKIAYKASLFKAIDPSFQIRDSLHGKIMDNIHLDSIQLRTLIDRGQNNRFILGTYNAIKDNGDIRLISNEDIYVNVITIYNNHRQSHESLYADLKEIEAQLKYKYAKEIKYQNPKEIFLNNPNKEQVIAEFSNYFDVHSLRYRELSRTVALMEETVLLINKELI